MRTIPFFKALSWLLVLNLLIKPVWIFFIDRQVQNIVGYEAYGKYFAVLNLSYVLFFLSDAGLSNMLNQKVANSLQVNVQQLIQLKIILLIVFSLVCCFAGWLTHISDWNILLSVVAVQALTSLFIFLRSIVTANQFFSMDAWFSVIDKSLMIIICGSIIYTSLFGTISLVQFLQIQIFCSGLAVISSFLFLQKKKLISAGVKDNIEKIVRHIVPFALIILLMSMHYRLDGFLLERIDGGLEAGIYASAYRLLDAGNVAGYLAASFLVAFIAKHLKDTSVIEKTVINTRHALLLFSIGISSFAIMFAPWIEKVLYHSDNWYQASVIALCVAALPAYYLVHIYGSMLTAASKFNQFITILVLSVALNIVLNILLIPSYGAIGCSIAALASQYFCGVVCCVVATRVFRISYHFKSILMYLLSAVFLLSVFYLGKLSLVNVWLILLIAVFIILLLLIIQIRFLKKYFVILR